MLLSFLSQIQSVPKDYSITYIRRWMAIHMANNVDYLWVIIFTFNTFTTCIFLKKSQKNRNFKLVCNINGKVSHFFTGKVSTTVYRKTGIFLEKSYLLHNQVLHMSHNTIIAHFTVPYPYKNPNQKL